MSAFDDLTQDTDIERCIILANIHGHKERAERASAELARLQAIEKAAQILVEASVNVGFADEHSVIGAEVNALIARMEAE